jgi:hypothetical protein
MANILKKENITIVIREYTDGQGNNKKVYKTIGELVTWQGDDGSTYQSGETITNNSHNRAHHNSTNNKHHNNTNSRNRANRTTQAGN